MRGRREKKNNSFSGVHERYTSQSIWAKGRKCVSSCLIILEQKKHKYRHGRVDVLHRPAYFNLTGVLNEASVVDPF